MPSADSSLVTPLAGAQAAAAPPAALRPALQIAPRAASTLLAAAACGLLLAHGFVVMINDAPDLDQARGIVKLFHLDAERNLPTLFASALLLLDGLLFALWARAGVGGTLGARAWRLLALLFPLLAFDEFFSLHERSIEPLRAWLGTGGLLHYAWVVPYGLAVAVLAAAFLPVFLRLPRGLQWRLALAAVLYLGGALGMELAGGALIAAGHAASSAAYVLTTTVEETLEMAGLIVLADTLLLQLAAQPGGLVLRIAAPAEAA